MNFHRLSQLFPMLEGEELEALARDIKANGLHEPITTYRGEILDGRNRYAACVIAEIEPIFREYQGDDSGLLAFIVSENLHRRHLTREQRDEIIRRLRAEGWTLQKIADATGVGRDTIHRVTRDSELSDFGKLIGADGKMRPMRYAPRQEPDEDDKELPPGYSHFEVYDESGGQTHYRVGPDKELRVVKIKAQPHVSQNSGSNEWYTPPEYIKAARAVMGGIDCDPASSAIANRTVGATLFYSEMDDGLTKVWRGRVWMNPPYAQPLITDFCNRLAEQFIFKSVTAACVLVNNATETAWFNVLLDCARAVCFIKGRVRFIDANGNASGAPLQGQAVLYLGEQPEKFASVFSEFGKVLFARQD